MDLGTGRGVGRRRLIGWVVVVVASVVAAGVALVSAGIDHADQVPTGRPDRLPPGALPPRSPGAGMAINGWFGTVSGVLGITVAVLPLAALTVWALARRRGVHGTTRAWRMSLAEVGIVYGTVPWVWLTLLPGGRAGEVSGEVSLVPLRDLQTILSGEPLTAVVQVVGNLLVFAALGFFAPMRFAVLASVPRIVALAAGCSVLVEGAQYVLRLDRVSSVDDVLLNAAGAGLAALASRRWWRARAVAPSDVRHPAAVGATGAW
jgi:hypothetical protein